MERVKKWSITPSWKIILNNQ